MIKKTKIQWYKNIFICDVCGERMTQQDYIMTTIPAQYEYKCKNCGNTERTQEGEIFYEEITL